MAKIDTKTVLAIGGGLALIGYLAKLSVDKIIENLDVQIGNPQFDSSIFDDGFIKVDIPVIISNQNPFAVNVKYFFGVVKYGDITLANVSLPIQFSVAPGTTKTINLDMDIPIFTVLDDLLSELGGGNILDVFLNKIYLSGKLQLMGNFVDVPIQLDKISIPIV